MLRDKTVTIVGLGLMGGSLALALHGHCAVVRGMDHDPAVVAMAIRRGIVDIGSTDLAEAITPADLVVLATPVRTILALIPQVSSLLRPGTLLLDIGSTKTAIMTAMASLPPGVEGIGGHPLCGKEIAGLTAAQGDLYQGKVFVLTPRPQTSPAALTLAQGLVQAIGARPQVLTPEHHDRLVAAISHLPYLESAALAQIAAERATADPLVWWLAASGFRDTSRLAASDVTMMLDILLTNGVHIVPLARQAAAQLEAMAAWIEAGDEVALRHALHDSQEAVVSYRLVQEQYCQQTLASCQR